VPVAIVTLFDEALPASSSRSGAGSRAPEVPATGPTTDSGLTFQADAPLVTSGGARLGRLTIQDRFPREFTAADLATLQELAAVVVDEIELDRESRRLSEEHRTRVETALQSAQDIAAVAAAIRILATSEDPGAVRRAICEIALQLSGADSVAILDLVVEQMQLVQTASAGLAWTIRDCSVTDGSPPAAAAFRSGKSVLVRGSAPAGDAGREASHETSPVVLWQPFPAGGRSTVAVLGLVWNGSLTLAPERLTSLMELVSAEATSVLERADLLTQLAALARTDELTELPNRRAINDDLAREMERARRESTALCVGLLDIDHFKTFNDSQGHPAGDRLLAAAATAWRQALRAGSDLLGRYGGEEFLVVLPAPLDDAFATVERLRASVPEGQTVSAGVARWDSQESAEALITRADVALYAAKAGGRNRTELAE
jgi:diguanylate cyclase (GGDEF)-like protein